MLNGFVKRYQRTLSYWSFIIYYIYSVVIVCLVYWRFPSHVNLPFLLPTLTVMTFFQQKTRITKSVAKFENETYIKVCDRCKCQRENDYVNHCGFCGECVEMIDHHCIFTSNCISKRNYKWYFGFIFTTMFTNLYLISVLFG